jgi:DNA invertase Pin-like site-specific DNA recombinase
MAGRPELARALDDLDAGDELVIAEWDRATRSMWDGLQIIKAVINAGASIKVLDRPYIDLETPRRRRFMAIMSAAAEVTARCWNRRRHWRSAFEHAARDRAQDGADELLDAGRVLAIEIDAYCRRIGYTIAARHFICEVAT